MRQILEDRESSTHIILLITSVQVSKVNDITITNTSSSRNHSEQLLVKSSCLEVEIKESNAISAKQTLPTSGQL
jgi:hypothetical protein